MRNGWKKVKKSKNLALFCVSIIILIFGISIIWLSSLQIPNFESFNDRKIVNSTKIYDRTGKILLYNIHQDIKKTDITFADMGVNIKNATIAIEDSEFYNHKGIRIKSIIRATLSNLFGGGGTQGGSTITQQLVKNTLLTQKVTVTRKIKEWVLAVKIEKLMTKEKIFEYYLNEAPYGGTTYGIEEASRTYFDKAPADLSLSEAAYLAAIPQSPTYLSPYGKNKDKLDERKNLVLRRMWELNFITEEEYNNAREEVVIFAPQVIGNIKAPHFVFFIKNYLEEKYGSEIVEKRGLKVTTTLNYELQKKGEEIVKEGALKNEKDWGGENAGLVAIDPKTGQILTMIGSRDYFDEKIDSNYNVATAHRQPGSSFKPFIYTTAFNKGFTPDTVLFDLPTEFQASCDAYGRALPGHSQSNCYKPDNYDGAFRGPMSLRNGLAQSINVIAVKLFYLSGLQDSLKTAEDMGISTLTDVGRYGLTLVIGGGEVTLLDMTSAYGVFANNGVRNPYIGVLKIEDSSGKVLEEFTSRSREVIPKNTALIISDILSDNESRAPTFGLNSMLLVPGYDTAVKTGTTNSNRDAWTIGYTPSVVVGVWAGNNDNRAMKKGGVAMAGPIWNKFIREALKDLPKEEFEAPDLYADPKIVKPVLRGSFLGNENFFIDKISGKLVTVNTPPETVEEKIVTNVHTILYWVDKKDILGPAPINPEGDPQFRNWETPIQNWWIENRYRYRITNASQKPTEEDDIHIEPLKPVVLILSPEKTTVYRPDERIKIEIESTSLFPLQKIDVFINNIYYDSFKPNSKFYFTPEDTDNLSYENELRLISYDSAYNVGESTTVFYVK